jgi:RNA polymerase sigma-70 factor (ECF subfamily)
MAARTRALPGTGVLRDPDELADGYARHVSRIYGYIAARVASREDAEDVTAETFERALRSRRTAPPEGALDRWLFGIARRAIADHFRRTRPAERLAKAHELLIDPAEGPEDMSVRREQVRTARAALAALTDEQQDVLALRFVGELTYSQIGDLIGRREDAVKKIAHRALAKIREEMRKGDMT